MIGFYNREEKCLLRGTYWVFNPYLANVLLRDLTSMGPCIVSVFRYISNKMQRYTVYLYLETAVHVSGGISTHHQDRIQLYLQHLVFVTPLLLSAAIVEDSSNGVTNTRCCRNSCMRSL
jgi:hypothetical protein